MTRKRKNTRSTTRKKTNAKERRKTEKKSRLKEELNKETMQGVLSILFLAFAVVFFMAGFGLAGRFGNSFYNFSHNILGFGYYLIPSSLLILSIATYKSSDKKIGLVRSGAMLLFFLSALAIIELISAGAGGKLGYYVLYPAVYAFDKIAGSLILLAVAVASLFVVFDTHPLELLSKIKRTHSDDKDEYSLKEEEKEIVEKALSKHEIKEDGPKDKDSEEKSSKKASAILDKIKDSAKKSKEIIDIKTDNLQIGNYKIPPLSILKKDKGKPSVGDVKANANRIKQTLSNFGILVEMDEITIGPTVTRYAMKPAEGVKLSKILGLQSNLELALAASPIRIEAPIPGKSLVGIEVPNSGKTMLGLAGIIGSPEFYSEKYSLPMALGKDITGKAIIADLAKMPHMIIAGATGAGKSVTIHDLIISFLYKYGPDRLRLILVDPKMVELTLYDGIPHLLTPVITDAKRTILTLKWLISEMERRYEILRAHKVQNLKSYQEQVYDKAKEKGLPDEEMPENLPFIVAVLDELADIMQMYPKELESAIVRIAQKARAVGIHLVLATQRPDVRTITGLIKANVPSRIALQVPSQIDSRTILDQAGAEKLLGAGDMLFLAGNMSKPVRVQAPFVSTPEIRELVKYINKNTEGELHEEIDFDSIGADSIAFSSGNLLEDDDERNSDEYRAALEFVIEAKKASTSLLQRKFRIGYNKAARFIDMMEEDGIIGPANGSKPREVLVDSLSSDANTESAQVNDADNNENVDLIDSEEFADSDRKDTGESVTIRYNNED